MKMDLIKILEEMVPQEEKGEEENLPKILFKALRGFIFLQKKNRE